MQFLLKQHGLLEVFEKTDDGRDAHAHDRERIERERIRHVGHGVIGAISQKGHAQQNGGNGHKQQDQHRMRIEQVQAEFFDLVLHIVTSRRE